MARLWHNATPFYLPKPKLRTTHAREIAELRAEAGRAEAAAESRIRALEAEKAMLDTRLADDRASHAREIEQRDAMMKAAEQQASERAAQFREQLDMAREQLKTTAADLLAARTADLNRANVRDIDNVLQPPNSTSREMKEAMDASRDINIRNTASLHQAISDIMERTAGIGAEADKLARALRHENKTQGNWGEVILSELLDSQGSETRHKLRGTVDHCRQKRPTGAQRDNRQAHIPRCHTPLLRQQGPDNRCESESVGISRLYRCRIRGGPRGCTTTPCKEYPGPRQGARSKRLPPLYPPPAPVARLCNHVRAQRGSTPARHERGAHTMARCHERGCVYIRECNLTAALRIIHLAWRQEVQAQSQRKVFEEANLLIGRVGDFYKTFTDIGARIDKAKEAFTDSANKLINGRQSLMVPARRLRDMGAKEKAGAPLPEPESESLLTELTDTTSLPTADT